MLIKKSRGVDGFLTPAVSKPQLLREMVATGSSSFASLLTLPGGVTACRASAACSEMTGANARARHPNYKTEDDISTVIRGNWRGVFFKSRRLLKDLLQKVGFVGLLCLNTCEEKASMLDSRTLDFVHVCTEL